MGRSAVKIKHLDEWSEMWEFIQQLHNRNRDWRLQTKDSGWEVEYVSLDGDTFDKDQENL